MDFGRSARYADGGVNSLKYVAFAAMLFGLPAFYPEASIAQTTSAPSAAPTAMLSAKIAAIDYDRRIVTLEEPKGNVQVMRAAPDVTQLRALGVGDTITVRYRDPVVLSIVKGDVDTAAGGDRSQTGSLVLTIQAIDSAAQTLAVKSQYGYTMTMFVPDKADIAKLAVGDEARITYSFALILDARKQ